MSRIAEAFDPTPYGGMPGFKKRGTSAEAAAAIAGESSILRERAYTAIQASGQRGLTADEVAAAIGRDRLAVRPRLTELAASGRIEPTGERRKNASGRSADVWRAK